MTFRMQQAKRAALLEDAGQWLQRPPTEWPPMKFNWDLEPAAYRFALDGMRAKEFSEAYPEGLQAAYAKIDDIEAVLCQHNRRSPEELWNVGCEHKLAWAIEYISRGLPITPVLIKPVPGSSHEIMFAGGNHRYAVAWASGLLEIPVLLEPCDLQVLQRRLRLVLA